MTDIDWTRLKVAAMTTLHLRPAEVAQMPPCDLVDLLQCCQQDDNDLQHTDEDGVRF